ncbi:MAG: Gfo/Idh/MocA family oxidoreductase [Planctomycetota bacterium]
MRNVTRRSFITGAAASAFSLAAWQRAHGANEDMRVAVVGTGGRGGAHISGYAPEKGEKLKGVRLVALCDVDSLHLDAAAAGLEKRGVKTEKFGNYRKLLESKEVDAISIATPNHQHSIQAIWAMQAGKDVYCEKPISHNVWEGRRVVEAAAVSGKICASGTQSRSNPGMIDAVKFIHDGKLGKIQYVRGLCYKRRASIGKVDGPQMPPKTVDYDQWCGPARMLPLTRKKLHYDWHWAWETGNGDLGNQGIHQMDISRWILGENTLSPKIFSIGGRFGYIDDGETPNTMITIHDYASAPLIFEVRGLPGKPAKEGEKEEMDELKGCKVGVIVQCEGGYMAIPSYNSAKAYDTDGKVIHEFKGEGNHFKNFIEAVQNRTPKTLNASILEGHLSSALCHTGNISLQLGKASSQEAIREKLKGNAVAQETFESVNMHLQTNLVDLNKSKLILGEFLTMDPGTETFVGNVEASKLLKREYRAPYTIPEKF